MTVRIFAAISLATLILALPAKAAAADEETRELSDFDAVSISVPFATELVYADEPFVTLEGDQDTIDEIKTEVEDDVLRITKDSSWFDWSDGEVTMVIGFTRLDSVSIQGSGDVFAEQLSGEEISASVAGSGTLEIEQLQCNEFTATVTGSGDIRVPGLEADMLRTSVTGSGSVEAGGRVNEQDVTITGSGDHDARDLRSYEATVKIRGSGDAEVWVEAALDAKIVGSGDIRYYGDPSTQLQSVGSGEIQHRGSTP